MTKETFASAGFGLPLAWLAELDNIPAPNALADAFGDRYLYRHNPIFTVVRDAAIGFGFRFSVEDTPLWRDYQALGLMALYRILASKTIPYFDTGITFARLLDADPAARLPAGFIAANMKRNYAFHESAHCVAHSLLRRLDHELRTVAPGERDRFVLEAILTESFANTVEAVGSVFRHLPVSDTVFYRLNSYFSCEEKREELLNRAVAEMGAELRFALLFLSYFEANLALQPPADSTYDRIAEASGCRAGQAGLAREITDTSFQLNASFRDSTTPTYFGLLGYSHEYKALANAVWLDRHSNRSFARDLASLLWEAAGKV